MAKKIKFYQTWDLKSIVASITTLLTLGLFGILYFSYPTILHYFKMSKYDSETTGRLIRVEEQAIIKQSLTGNEQKVDHYEVVFSYQIGRESFLGKDMILGTISNRNNLRKILNSPDSAVYIKYRSDDSTKSAIDLTK